LTALETGALGLILGAAVGLIQALSGAGGGILAVPLLVFGLQLTIVQAAPVGLIAVGLSAALGAALGLRDGLVRYRAAALIGVVGMALAPLGSVLADRLPNAPLLVAFAAVLAVVAWRMAGRSRQAAVGAAARPKRPPPPCVLDPAQGRLIWTRPCAWALAAIGAAAGTLSGLLGVGGGFVIVPSLTRLTNLDARSIVATSLAVIALVSMSAVVAATLHRAVRWDIAGPFAAGAVGALAAGRIVAGRISELRLQQAFALVCAAASALLLARGLGWSAG
jgi:uncharacterized membrane protein YfcA